jgi:hypothetical protein
MRYLPTLGVFLLLLSSAFAAGPAKKTPVPIMPPVANAPVGSLSPAGQLRAAVLDLSTRVPATDQAQTRYISLYAVPADKLASYRVLLTVLLNTVSQADAIGRPAIVPDTGDRLLRVRLVQFRWTREAFSAVARRDPYFREPEVPHRETEFGRQVIGVAQDPKTFAAEFIVEATFLMRSILQPDGFSPTYYDLLYARQRFGDGAGPLAAGEPLLPPDPGPEPAKPKERPWKGGIWHADGKDYAPGQFTYVPFEENQAYVKALAAWQVLRAAREQAAAVVPRASAPGGVKKDFPANLKDWQAFWGVEDVDKFDKDRGFASFRAEVALGTRNARNGKGSYVAFNDRVVVVTRVPTGFYLETHDAVKNTKDRDFLENPLGIVRKQVKSDGGELLVHLPNGFQAALLVNGVGDRVDAADSRIARNTADNKDVTVRTQIGCIQCHSLEGGYISPVTRKVRESIEAGLKLNIRNEDEAIKARAVLLGWEREEQEIRFKMARAIQDATTYTVGVREKWWSAAEMVAVMMDFRDWYDQPVTMAEAVAYFGLSGVQLFPALTLSPTSGLNLIAVGGDMPRAAWDDKGVRDLQLLLALFRASLRVTLAPLNVVPFGGS